MLEMLKEERTIFQIAVAYQIHSGQWHRWKRQALDHFPQLFTESETLKQQGLAHDQEVTELYAPIGKLITLFEWLKKNLASTLSCSERAQLVDSGPKAVPLTTQTGPNRTGLYYLPTGLGPVEVALKHRIDAIYTDRPFYASRRKTSQLQSEGYTVNRKRIPH